MQGKHLVVHHYLHHDRKQQVNKHKDEEEHCDDEEYEDDPFFG